MLDLPITRAEARRSARRWPTYGARAAYGLMLLGFLGLFRRVYGGWSAGRSLSSRELTSFADAAFEWLAVGQVLIVLALVPALAGGALAEERSRGTLPGLLASRLSGAAIILDKLTARMLYVGVILEVGLPIACLLGLLGGVDPRSVAYAYGGTLSIAFFLAALSLLVSVYARVPRDAVLLLYLIEALWLVVPWFANFALARSPSLWSLATVNDWIVPTTPLSLVGPSSVSARSGRGPVHGFLRGSRQVAPAALARAGAGPGTLTTPWAWMVGLQLAYGAAFLAWAAWRLRPTARLLADPPLRRFSLGRDRRRTRPRPACGDDPMLWKERYSAGGGSTRPIRILGMLGFGFLILLSRQAVTYHWRLALDEFFLYGYGIGQHGEGVLRRAMFLRHLNGYAALFYVVALVAIAVESATGITGEREAGTWDGLLGTPLESATIVRAKVLGALIRQRTLLALVIAPWLFRVVLWALHPVGLLLEVACAAASLVFASALGTLASLRSKTSGRALVRTLSVLLLLNLGTVVAGKLLLGSGQYGALFGSMPALLLSMPVSTLDMNHIVRSGRIGLSVLGLISAYVAAYAALAWVLCRCASRQFDDAADRPR